MAITNGNAQTDHIPCLKDLFDFCVLAEQVGLVSSRNRFASGVAWLAWLSLCFVSRDEGVFRLSRVYSNVYNSTITCMWDGTAWHGMVASASGHVSGRSVIRRCV